MAFVASRTAASLRPAIGRATLLRHTLQRTQWHRVAPPTATAFKCSQFHTTALSRADGQPEVKLSLTDRIAKALGWFGGFYARKQVLTRSAKELYATCAEQGMNSEFHKVCGLPDTFQSWFLVTQLHLYLCLVRLKAEGGDGSFMYKQMVTFFWQDVEYRMKNMGVDDSTVIKESTRELLSMFYGLVFAYDEGLVGSDADLAAALWRNMFHDCKDTFNAADVATMVQYVRREMRDLDGADMTELMDKGKHSFGPLV